MTRIRWVFGAIVAAVVVVAAAAVSWLPRRRPKPRGDKQRAAVEGAEAAVTDRADERASNRLSAIATAATETDVDAAAAALADLVNRDPS